MDKSPKINSSITPYKDNYFRVHPSFFPHLPLRSKVIIGDTGEWYVKKHKSGAVILENQRDGGDGDFEYKKSVLPYGANVILWKMYDESCVIELRLIYNSLAEKDERIRELETQVSQIMEKLEIH
jgi:hypothetical protein